MNTEMIQNDTEQMFALHEQIAAMDATLTEGVEAIRAEAAEKIEALKAEHKAGDRGTLKAAYNDLHKRLSSFVEAGYIEPIEFPTSVATRGPSSTIGKDRSSAIQDVLSGMKKGAVMTSAEVAEAVTAERSGMSVTVSEITKAAGQLKGITVQKSEADGRVNEYVASK